MRILQVILSISSCLFIVAAVAVGAFLHDLFVVLALMLCAIVCAGAMFIVRKSANEKADREARKTHRDFMDPPDDPPAGDPPHAA